MRPLLLALLAVTLAACGPDRERSAAQADADPALSVVTDSLIADDPALRYAVRIAYPQVAAEGGALPAPVRAANAAIRDTLAAFARSFRPESAPPPEDSLFRVDVQGGVDGAFLGDGVFSALVDVYAYTGGAHGVTVFQPLTVDLRTGRALRTADLFAPGAPYGDVLATWVERAVVDALARQLGTTREDARRTVFYDAGLDRLRAGEADVTLGSDSLRVHVPPYQLAAYAAGPFHVGVPYAALAEVARPGGPLARLAED